jgi:hypothetical protein
MGQFRESKVFPGKYIAFSGAALVAHSADPFYNVIDVDDTQAAVSANDHWTREDTLNHLCAIITIATAAEHEAEINHYGGEIWAIGMEHQLLGLMFGRVVTDPEVIQVETKRLVCRNARIRRDADRRYCTDVE